MINQFLHSDCLCVFVFIINTIFTTNTHFYETKSYFQDLNIDIHVISTTIFHIEAKSILSNILVSIIGFQASNASLFRTWHLDHVRLCGYNLSCR